MSEFGFQALPPLKTIATYAEPADWNMTSYIMEHHQRSGSGNGLMIAQMTDTFRMPKDFRLAGLPEHDPAGRGHPLRRGTLAAQPQPRQRHAHLAAERLLAGGLVGLARLFWALEGAALCRQTFLCPAAALGGRLWQDRARSTSPATWSSRSMCSSAGGWKPSMGRVLQQGEQAVRALALADTLVSSYDFSTQVTPENQRKVVFVAEMWQGARTGQRAASRPLWPTSISNCAMPV